MSRKPANETPPPLEVFKEVRAINDQLGRYSDHEGQEDGSTYYFWNHGQDAFDLQCSRAIEDHQTAIRVWRKLRRINQKRQLTVKDRQEPKK